MMFFGIPGPYYSYKFLWRLLEKKQMPSAYLTISCCRRHGIFASSTKNGLYFACENGNEEFFKKRILHLTFPGKLFSLSANWMGLIEWIHVLLQIHYCFLVGAFCETKNARLLQWLFSRSQTSHWKVHFLQNFYMPSYLTRRQTRTLPKGCHLWVPSFLKLFSLLDNFLLFLLFF